MTREWKGEEEEVIKKAKEACTNSQHKVEDHFVDMHDMIEIGKGVKPLKSLAERCPKTCLWLIA
jgi:DNA-damage-inducible protein D